jgi:hypothetical protein
MARATSAQRRLASGIGKQAVLILFAVIAVYPILQMWFTALRPAK